MKSAFKKNIVICVLILLSLALSIETYKFVKINTGIILWDYQIACDAFFTARERLEDGKMTDEQVALELAGKAFKPIWQTRDLSEPLLIRSKWYSHNLHDFLFECSAARNHSAKELKALVDQIADVSEELSRVKWEDIRLNGSLAGRKQEIFETIENVDKRLEEY